jgi:flagellar motor protein MotB
MELRPAPLTATNPVALIWLWGAKHSPQGILGALMRILFISACMAVLSAAFSLEGSAAETVSAPMAIPENPCDWIPAAEAEAAIGPLAEPPRREEGRDAACRYVLKIPADVAANRQKVIEQKEMWKQKGATNTEMGKAFERDPTSYALVLFVDPTGSVIEELVQGSAGAILGMPASGDATAKQSVAEGWDNTRFVPFGFGGRVGHVAIKVESRAPDVLPELPQKLAEALRDRLPDVPIASPDLSFEPGDHDPCTTLSREAAETVLGPLAVAPFRSTGQSPLADVNGMSCTYFTPGHRALVITPTLSHGKEEYEMALRVGGVLGSVTGVSAESLTGPWDKAMFEPTTGALMVLKGDVLLRFDYLTSRAGREGVIKLAKLALGVPLETSQLTAPPRGSELDGTSSDAIAPDPGTQTVDPTSTSAAEARPDVLSGLSQILGGYPLTPRLHDVPPGLSIEGQCPAEASNSETDIAADATQAEIPLKVGLTLSSTWSEEVDPRDVECLAQVASIGEASVDFGMSCSLEGGVTVAQRRTCHSDLRKSSAYLTEHGPDTPTTLVGATTVNLSIASFAELKESGVTRHSYVEALGSGLKLSLQGDLKKESSGTQSVIVNDRSVELPVIRASATLRGTCFGEPCERTLTAAILDEPRFPLVLDYRFDTRFYITRTKISFPTDDQVEKRLRDEKRIDIYGIYFDFASDRIRSESTPVLLEIAEAMIRNPDWKLRISGHTDGIGDDESNLILSTRRSEAVRDSLVMSGIASDRLTTAGFGEAQPKDTNDTPEGRAKNRRVELLRE